MTGKQKTKKQKKNVEMSLPQTVSYCVSVFVAGNFEWWHKLTDTEKGAVIGAPSSSFCLLFQSAAVAAASDPTVAAAAAAAGEATVVTSAVDTYPAKEPLCVVCWRHEN